MWRCWGEMVWGPGVIVAAERVGRRRRVGAKDFVSEAQVSYAHRAQLRCEITSR